MSLRGSWHLIGLLAVAIALGLAAVVELGPPTSSARTSREVVTAAQGVVQSTVTGTGNVEPSTDVEADFQTSGTLQHVYIADGDSVVKGQLIATLDPSSAQATVDQAEESLAAAQDQLANAETATVTTSSSDDTGSTSTTEDTALELPAATTTTTVTVTAPQRTTTAPTRTTTTPTRTSTTPTRTTTSPTRTTTSPTQTTTATTPTRTTTNGGSGSSQSSSSSTGASSGGESADTKAANIASAEASVDSAEASLTNAERTLDETKLYAPAAGTVVSVQDISPGDAVSGGSSASDSSSDASGSGSTGTGTGSSATTSAGSLGSSSASSSSSSSSSSGFAEIVNAHTMTMTVAFSESDISKVKVGQPATVTLEALTGVELGAHVTSISTLGTTSNSVVSYDATLTLDQRDSQVKPGMSASAAVITGQARGVTLPNSAVSSRGATATVQELRKGKTISTPIIVGLQGDTRTQIASGLSAGDQVVVTETLPSLGASSSSSSTASGTLGGGGAGGFGGGAGGFGGGGFARRFGGG